MKRILLFVLVLMLLGCATKKKEVPAEEQAAIEERQEEEDFSLLRDVDRRRDADKANLMMKQALKEYEM